MRPRTKLYDLAQKSKLQRWTGDHSVAELAGQWLKNCQLYHESCQKHSGKGWLPSRLLDISLNLIRLRVTSETPISGPYATLSHCWSKERFWVLNPTTMSPLLEGISFDVFPQTFQQAIVTARRFNIRYLWIDCYCIIQGSDRQVQADWEFETARMSQVYSNALLNIGAAHALNPTEGLLSTRRAPDDWSCTIAWRAQRIMRRKSGTD